MLPDWRFYELQIHQLLAYEYPSFAVVHNVYIKGLMSQRNRQIDVALFKAKTNKLTGIAECKYLKSRNIDVTIVDAMIGKMRDVGDVFQKVCQASLTDDILSDDAGLDSAVAQNVIRR